MPRINQHALARRVAQREGKKVQVNIAQIAEVQRVTFQELARAKPSDVLELIERHKSSRKR